MKVTVKVEGLRELDAALGELAASTSTATAKGAMRRALIAAAEPMAQAARDLVPVASGQLRKSIAVSTKLANPAGKAEFAATLKAGGSKGQAVQAMRDARREAKGSTVEVYVGAGQLPHAHLVEFGSVHNAPKPFMRPAFEATKEQVLEGIKTHLADQIAKAAARAAKRAAKAGK